jgi:hypothetical protein
MIDLHNRVYLVSVKRLLLNFSFDVALDLFQGFLLNLLVSLEEFHVSLLLVDDFLHCELYSRLLLGQNVSFY